MVRSFDFKTRVDFLFFTFSLTFSIFLHSSSFFIAFDCLLYSFSPVCRETQKQINKFDIELKIVWRNWNIFCPFILSMWFSLHLSFPFFFHFENSFHSSRLQNTQFVYLFQYIMQANEEVWENDGVCKKLFHYTETRPKTQCWQWQVDCEERESIFGDGGGRFKKWNGIDKMD